MANRLWKFFSSLKLALALFVLLVISTMIGSIVLQRPIAEPGQLERVYSPETLKWLDRFDFLDVFHSWWFVLQLFLLAVNVTITSIDMWPRFRRRIQSFRPVVDELHLPSAHARISYQGDLNQVVQKAKELVRSKFRSPHINEKDGKVYLGAQSGRWAHLGVYVIHTGLVLILIGGLITARKGFEGMITLAAGEKSDFYLDRKDRDRKVPLGFEVHCLQTWMERYPDGTPKSYFSELQVVDQGKVVAHRTIKVNEPLEYKGIYFYQATFGQQPTAETTEFTLEVKDPKTGKVKVVKTDYQKKEKLPFGQGSLEVVNYVENVPLNMEGHQRNLGEAVQLSIDEGSGSEQVIWVFKNYPDFDTKMRQGRYAFVFKDFRYDYQMEAVTGLQVAKNPGINVTWIGSTLLLLGLLWTFWLPHRKLWMVISPAEILIAAHSHRHPTTFLRKVKKLVESLNEGLKGTISYDAIKT